MADNLLDDTSFLLGSQAADDVASSIGDTTAMIAGLELSEARLAADDTSPLRVKGQGAHLAKPKHAGFDVDEEPAAEADEEAFAEDALDVLDSLDEPGVPSDVDAALQDTGILEQAAYDDLEVQAPSSFEAPDEYGDGFDYVGDVAPIPPEAVASQTSPALPYQQVQRTRRHTPRETREDSAPARRRSAIIAAAVVAAVVLVGCAVAWGALLRSGFGGGGTDASGIKRASATEIDEARDVLLPKEIKELVTSSFSYDGKDLSLPASGVGVEVRAGHVVVTHRLSPETTPNPKRVVRLAGMRAALLAEMLSGRTVVHDESDLGAEFADLVWIVNAANGKTFVAVKELPGEMAEGAGYYGALQASNGYVIAETLLKALGSSSGLTAQAGDAPVDVKGKIIVANAVYTKPKKNEATSQNVNFDQKSETKEEEKKDEDKEKEKENKDSDKKKDDKKEEAKPSTPSKPSTQEPEPSKPTPDPEPTTPDPELTTPDPQPTTPDPEPDPEPTTPDPEPTTPDPEPTPTPDPGTQNDAASGAGSAAG